MSTHKHIDKICCVVLAVTLLLTLLFMNGEKIGIKTESTVMGYTSKLFDTTTVHNINIIMDDWDEFIDSCTSEEYSSCTVVIDNEAYKNVAIRAKGNTSLTQVQSYDNDRYSFKIEFDRYDSSKTYYGLDKLCLNNIIQDNTYMKDYLTYQMMGSFGVASPLCSYVYITVNGEDWGLYLAVEGVEDSFLQRNYGKDYGELYKPDSQSMGGGKGNGKEFDMDEIKNNFENNLDISTSEQTVPQFQDIPDGANGTEADEKQFGGGNGNMQRPFGDNEQGGAQLGSDLQMPNMSEGEDQNSSFKDMMQNGKTDGNQGGMSMGSDDVKLIYSDDSYSSYSNIFDNAKTDISNSDKDRLIASLKSLNEGDNIENVVDVESVIRYFVVHNFVLNFDSYTGSMIHNYYLYEKDGQMSMIPWDYNLAFGGFQSSADATSLVNYPIDSPVSGGSADDRPMLAWIFADETYTELYHEYFNEFISDFFTSGYVSEMIDNVKEMIAPYVEKDPTKFCTYDEFLTGIDTLKQFCLLRAESISDQLSGTIGTTSDTQDSNTFVDASSIKISDMGSMNNNNSMGQGGKRGNSSETNGNDAPSQDFNTNGQIPQKPSTEGENTDESANIDISNNAGKPANTNEGANAGEPANTNEAANAGEPANTNEASNAGEPANINEAASAGEPANTNEAASAGKPANTDSGENDTSTSATSAESAFDPNNGQNSQGQMSDGQMSEGNAMENKNPVNDSNTPSVPGQSVENAASSLIMLGASVGILLLGLLIALIYKRRK